MKEGECVMPTGGKLLLALRWPAALASCAVTGSCVVAAAVVAAAAAAATAVFIAEGDGADRGFGGRGSAGGNSTERGTVDPFPVVIMVVVAVVGREREAWPGW